jgi:restriction system protein
LLTSIASKQGLRSVRSRRNGFIYDLAKEPWPAGLVLGLLLFLLIRYGVPAWIASHGGPLAQAFARGVGAFGMLAWLVLAACWFAALVSFLDARRKRRLLETRTDLDSLAATGWRDFERLVGEAFRRQGYAVEETGLGGADGGIDLILRRDGRRTLVQCKQWRRDRIPVNVVREMYGLLGHHKADKVIIAAWGGFTLDAASFASDKPIELIDGETLLGMIRAVQAKAVGSANMVPRNDPVSAAPTNELPACPKCGLAMIRRSNRRDGNQFWGCKQYPACRGTR